MKRMRPDSTASIAGSASGFVANEPLVRQERFDDVAAAVTARHHQLVVVHALQQTGRIQVRDDLLARSVAIHAAVRFRRVVVQRGVDREHVDHRQVVTAADLRNR